MENNVVYHGSSVPALKELKPHQSTHGCYVYATPIKEIAIIMSKRCGDDATYSLDKYTNDKYQLVERIPFAFDKMFSNSFSLYTLDASSFKDINTGFNEVVSDNSVKVLKEEKYDNLVDAIKSLEKEGLIEIYYYPNRPSTIPKDDSDLIELIRNVYIEKLHITVTSREISRWIFLHPNLEDELRLIAKEQDVEVPSYEEIKDNMIREQEHDLNHELYIDCALEMKRLVGENNGKSNNIRW